LSSSEKPFWKTKKLEEMSAQEWESLCDGCGRCCLVKLEDEDTSQIYATDVVCRLFDAGTCQCSNYPQRQEIVPDCIRLTPEQVAQITWLPPTCAYRLVREGADLHWWHPLISGSAETVHEAGVSVRGRVSASEDDIPLDDLPDHIVAWPMQVPEILDVPLPSRQRKPAGQKGSL
jgi:uncharacterized cysteine cluster protein YcgN (CxxCxxCC family)